LEEGLDEGLPLHYDVRCIQAYWNRRPLDVGMRAAVIGREALPFACGVMMDQMEDRQLAGSRAVELREMLTRLGPTFIKVCVPEAKPPAGMNPVCSKHWAVTLGFERTLPADGAL